MVEKRKKPLTRNDVLERIKRSGGTEGLDLSGETFADGIDLSDLDLSGIILRHALFVRAHLERTVLFVADLEGASLMDTHLEDAVLIRADLDRTFLYEAHLEGVHLHGARFSSGTHLESADWGSYIIGEEKKGRYDQAEHIYRKLKMWYTQAGYSDTAAKFYYREKEADRKSLKWRSKSSFRHRLALQASYLVFGHGEDWKRVLYWIAFVIFGLAAAYYFWGSFGSPSFWDTLYYSAASFTALGYGQWAPQPTGWAKGMGAAEAIIGVFMMALLLVTFVRKWTR